MNAHNIVHARAGSDVHPYSRLYMSGQWHFCNSSMLGNHTIFASLATSKCSDSRGYIVLMLAERSSTLVVLDCSRP